MEGDRELIAAITQVLEEMNLGWIAEIAARYPRGDQSRFSRWTPDSFYELSLLPGFDPERARLLGLIDAIDEAMVKASRAGDSLVGFAAEVLTDTFDPPVRVTFSDENDEGFSLPARSEDARLAREQLAQLLILTRESLMDDEPW